LTDGKIKAAYIAPYGLDTCLSQLPGNFSGDVHLIAICPKVISGNNKNGPLFRRPELVDGVLQDKSLLLSRRHQLAILASPYYTPDMMLKLRSDMPSGILGGKMIDMSVKLTSNWFAKSALLFVFVFLRAKHAFICLLFDLSLIGDVRLSSHPSSIHIVVYFSPEIT